MPAGVYWDYQLIQNYRLPRATFGEEPLASNLKKKGDEPVRLWPKNEIHVVVAGGETNGYWRIYGARRGAAVNIDDWR